MGLFSGKTIYTVDTSTTRIIDDAHVSDTLLRALIDGIFGTQGIPESLINAIPGSMGRRADKMFDHIKEAYPQGLMRSRVTSNRGQLGSIIGQVEADTGHVGLEVLYAQLSGINFNHMAYEALVATHGFNPVSNELAGLSASMGGVVYLKDFTVVAPQDVFDDAVAAGTARPFDQGPASGYTPNRPASALASFARAAQTLEAEARPDVAVIVEWIRRATDGTLTEGTVEVPLANPDNDLEVFHVKYRYLTDIHYWSYTHRAGTNPVLDGLYDVSVTEPAQFMPVIYFRRNHTNLSAGSGTEFDAAQKALDILGINYGEMGAAIHDNPDIGDVRNSYVMFGAAVDSTNESVRRYLYEFFNDLVIQAADLEADQGEAFGYGVLGLIDEEDSGRLSIRMTPNQPLGDHHMGASMTLTARSAGARLVGGKLGPVGSFHSAQSTHSYTYEYQARKLAGGGEYTYETRTRTRSYPVLLLRRQVTNSTYHEVRVNDPSLRHHIDGSGRGTNNGLGDPDLLIPIDYERIKAWGTREKEMLLQHSLHLIFNVRDVQKVAWYQTGIFQIVVLVAAIVIAYFTGQFQAIALALATGTIGALAWSFALAVIKSLALKYTFKVIAEELGGDFALYLAVALAIYGGYTSFQSGSIEGAPFAEEMLMASSGLGNAAAEQFSVDLEGLASDYDDLLGIEEEREADLERARSLLNTNSHMLNPMNFILGESPENFYQRTVHSGNIGALGFEAIHSYVDAALTLPGTE